MKQNMCTLQPSMRVVNVGGLHCLAPADSAEAAAPTPEGSFTKSLHDGSVTLASLSEELLAGFLGEEAPAADDGAWDADW